VEHDNVGVPEVADTYLPTDKLTGKTMGTDGDALRQEYVGLVSKATVSERLMHSGSPILQLRLNRNEGFVRRTCDDVGPASLVIKLFGYVHLTPWGQVSG
jgi:hypothetical protein